MKKLKYFRYKPVSRALWILGLLILTACSEDFGYRSEVKTNENGLVIYIPNVASAADMAVGRAVTRAEEETKKAQGEEANFNDLYLLTINLSDNNKLTTIPLTNPEKEGEYAKYDISLKPGKYNFYLVGNLDSYIENKVSSLQNEDAVRKALLNFSYPTEKSILKSDNLPMGCLAEEIEILESSGSKTKVNKTRGVEIEENKSTILYADLTFLCAKVRYTILFDKESFSSNFPTSEVNFISSGVYNLRKQTAWKEGTANEDVYAEPFKEMDFNSVSFPNKDSEKEKRYLTQSKDDEIPDNLTAIENQNGNKRAWQGVVYVPANELQTKITTLEFGAIGQGMKDTYSLPLNWDKDGIKGIEKGKFYDVVCKMEDPQSLNLSSSVNVEPWTTQHLQYSLHGPYELVVETSSLDLTAGEPKSFWYRSDITPEHISFEFPQTVLNGETVDFYIASVKKDEKGEYALAENGEYQIEVKVNPEIPYTEFQNNYNTEDQKSSIKYFNIVAGSIHKRIEINNLNLKSFFTVYPQEILVDVREYITSAINSQDLFITIDSNFGEEIKWNFSSLDNNNNGEIELSGSNGILEWDGDNFKLDKGTGKLKVSLNKFMDKSDFWKSSNTFKLILTTAGETREILIKVKPYTTDYIIHFKVKDADKTWSEPHIYVYQNLEIPVDYEGTDKNGIKIAGKTVGYGPDENSDSGLEYLFTNNISFRGWKGYGGPVSLNKEELEYVKGYVHVGNKNDVNGDGRFNVSNQNTSIYNYTIDYNSTHSMHREIWPCSICNKYNQPSDYNNGSHTFTGICMEPEDNGWWKYTLSGVATPGKAMIMFTNGHNRAEDNSGYRYPNENQVGVLLFDFSDNEGWFLFDGNSNHHTLSFYDEEPFSPQALGINDKIRFEWKNNYISGNEASYLYFWNKDNDLFNNERYPGLQREGITEDGYCYLEIDVKDYPWLTGLRKINCMINEGIDSNGKEKSKTNTITIKVDDYLDTYENRKYTIRIEGGNDNTKIYRFYWPINLGEFIHLRTDKGKVYTNTDYTSTGTLDFNIGYYYYEMTDNDFGTLYYTLNKNSQGEKSTGKTLDDFGQEGETNYYCAYITTNGGTCKTDKPSAIWDTKEVTSGYTIFDDNNSTKIKFNGSTFFNVIFNYKEGEFIVRRLEKVEIPDGTNFKIELTTNNSNHWGSYVGKENIFPNIVFDLKYKNAEYIRMNGDFRGDMYILEDNTDYAPKFVMYLISEN